MNGSNRPLIVVTTYGRNEALEYPLPAYYVDAVRTAGAACLLLPPGDECLDTILDVADGVVLAGGGDIDPACYGADQHAASYMIDSERDAMEITLAKQLLQKRMPILAICRGMQIVNVALGGTLHGHLPEVYGEAIAHRLPPREPVRHVVWVDGGSRVGEIIAKQDVSIVSWHHQAVDRLGGGLRVTAKAEDGAIEALELEDNPNFIAVQWHPEMSAAEDARQQRLFEWLVDVSRVKRGDTPDSCS